jgi:dihydrofolate synthase/folylpolyglutamate synthase
MTNYHQLLNQLFSINVEKKMRLGLERCHEMHQALGSPADSFDVVHVAGTNGKGSVCAKISTALQASGLRVGTFTSPHISTFRERIRIDGGMIPEDEAEVLLEHIMRLHHDASFFEIVTMLALYYFARKNVDIAVLETGMGGRLDATNIVKPLVSVITSISLDHTQYLGNTIELIAWEKAGIIKPGVPVVIGPHVPEGIMSEKIRQLGGEPGELLHSVNGSYSSYDDENSAVARRALELLNVPLKAIEEGVKAVPPCRFETLYCPEIDLNVVLDVGHNPDGIERFFRRLAEVYQGKSYRAVVGISKGKEISGIFDIILRYCPHVHLVCAANERALPADELLNSLSLLGFDTCGCVSHSSVKEGIASAKIEAAKADEVLVVCGSFFIMADARKELGILEPSDFTDLNERL